MLTQQIIHGVSAGQPITRPTPAPPPIGLVGAGPSILSASNPSAQLRIGPSDSRVGVSSCLHLFLPQSSSQAGRGAEPR